MTEKIVLSEANRLEIMIIAITSKRNLSLKSLRNLGGKTYEQKKYNETVCITKQIERRS